MVVSFVNQKGGVAKTTSCYNIAAAMANSNKKVLMVDFDPQATLSIVANFEPDEHLSIINVFDGIPIKQCISQINSNLSIIPGSSALAVQEADMLLHHPEWRTMLKNMLKPIYQEYDYILIDSPPQLGTLTINALTASDYFVVPAQTTYEAYRGIENILQTASVIQEAEKGRVKLLGIIATLFEKQQKDNVEVLDLMKGHYIVLGTIRRAAAIRKGIEDGLSVVQKIPKSDVAEAYTMIAQKMILLMKEVSNNVIKG